MSDLVENYIVAFLMTWLNYYAYKQFQESLGFTSVKWNLKHCNISGLTLTVNY